MERQESRLTVQTSEFAAQARHFFLCTRCGQYVDERDGEQVRHHQRLSHKPLNPD